MLTEDVLCFSAVDEGNVFAMCMTGQGDQAILNQWISGLQENNPILGRIPTLFRLEAGPRELQGVADPDPGHSYGSDPETETQAKEDSRPQPDLEYKPGVEEEHRRSQGVKQ